MCNRQPQNKGDDRRVVLQMGHLDSEGNNHDYNGIISKYSIKRINHSLPKKAPRCLTFMYICELDT
jgi:hypothetical protein